MDLIGQVKSPLLALEPLHPLVLLQRQAGLTATVDLALVDPRSEQFRCDPELAGDPGSDSASLTVSAIRSKIIETARPLSSGG